MVEAESSKEKSTKKEALTKRIKTHLAEGWSVIRNEPSSNTFSAEKAGALRTLAIVMFFFCTVHCFILRGERNTLVTLFEYLIVLVMMIGSYIRSDRARVVVAHVLMTMLILGITHNILGKVDDGLFGVWMLLMPPIFMYFYTVRMGLCSSIILFIETIVLFYTPYREHFIGTYSEVFMNRIVPMFLADIWITAFAMITHRRNKAYWRNRDSILADEVMKERNKISDISVQTIISTWNAMSAKNPEIAAHCDRVARLCVKMAERLGWDEHSTKELQMRALLHDIGTIGISDEVLEKKLKYGEESDEYKQHVRIGTEILENMTLIPRLEEGARYHHERADGSGYPEGLTKDQIPFDAKMIGIADACDELYMALIREEKEYLTSADIKNYIHNGLDAERKSAFEPEVVDLLEEVLSDEKIY